MSRTEQLNATKMEQYIVTKEDLAEIIKAAHLAGGYDALARVINPNINYKEQQKSSIDEVVDNILPWLSELQPSNTDSDVVN